jgi:pilus assembly protein Flp/PilA
MTKLTPPGRSTPSRTGLARDVRGASLVEYIILVGVVALIALAGFKVFGEKVDAKVKNQASKVSGI